MINNLKSKTSYIVIGGVNLGLTYQDIKNMHSITVKELAMQLENDLIHACSVDENISVYEYIKKYLND